ncbi:MAG: hypothetical protein HRT74_05495 [Flavobacteriales bacterium]|nr:hypothetical protein [Flavobacteriales bacterium]
MDKVVRIIMAVLRSLIIVIGLAACAIIVVNSVTEESVMEGMSRYGTSLNIVYNLTLVTMFLCVLFVIVFGLAFFFLNIKKRIGTLIGIVALLAVVGISYGVLASDVVTPALAAVKDDTVTPELSSFAGGSQYIWYILLFIAVGAALFSEVSRIFK